MGSRRRANATSHDVEGVDGGDENRGVVRGKGLEGVIRCMSPSPGPEGRPEVEVVVDVVLPLEVVRLTSTSIVQEPPMGPTMGGPARSNLPMDPLVSAR